MPNNHSGPVRLVVCRLENPSAWVVESDLSDAVHSLREQLISEEYIVEGELLYKFKTPIPLPADHDVLKPLRDVSSDNLELLQDPCLLSSYFPEPPLEYHLHIMVKDRPVFRPGSKRRLEFSTQEDEEWIPKRLKQEETVQMIKDLLLPPKYAQLSTIEASLQNENQESPILHLRPQWRRDRPTCLFNAAFDHFLTNIRNETLAIPPERFDLARKFMPVASAIYQNADLRRKAYRPFFKDLFGQKPHSLKIDDVESGDAILHSSSAAPLFWVYKNEVGEGESEPLDQAGAEYARFWVEQSRKQLRRHSYSPSLLIVVAGPWLSVLSAVFVEKVMVEPLTDLIFCVERPNDDYEGVGVIARLFQALHLAHRELTEYYDRAVWPQYPYPSRDRFTNRDGKEVHLRYREILDEYRLLWVATDCDTNQDVIVKFAPRYCVEAHQCLADAGFAPKLLNIVETDTVWKMVVMEYISGVIPWPSLSENERKQVIPVVEKAMEVLHRTGYVFGDLRPPNILVVRKEQQEEHMEELKESPVVPILVDFDWCGKNEQAKYPFSLSDRIKWPEGVAPGGLMRFEHDEAFLRELKEFWG